MTQIPDTLAPFFPEYDFATLDVEADAQVIVERVLEYGTRTDLRWLFVHYGQDRIRDFVRRRGCRALSKRAFNYWRLVLGVDEYQQPPWVETATELWGR